jgi:hypothetical protein
MGKGKGEREGKAAPVTSPVRQDRRPFASAESCTSRRGEGRDRPRWSGSRDGARNKAPL